MLPRSITAIMLAAILIIASMATFPITSLTAQLTTGNNNSATNTTSSIIPDTTTTIFQSNVDGIRVQVPSGWIADDIDNIELFSSFTGKDIPSELLVVFCPQSETLPKIGGGYVCSEGAHVDVWVERYADLKSKPEFAGVVRNNKSITTSDFLAYIIQLDEEVRNITDHRILKNIDKAVNVIDSQTNRTIATAPAKYVEMSYSVVQVGRIYRDISLQVLSNDGNTGYLLTAHAPGSAQKLPPEHQQIFDSFELVK